jgi:hypothetical protein
MAVVTSVIRPPVASPLLWTLELVVLNVLPVRFVSLILGFMVGVGVRLAVIWCILLFLHTLAAVRLLVRVLVVGLSLFIRPVVGPELEVERGRDTFGSSSDGAGAQQHRSAGHRMELGLLACIAC